MKKTCVLMVSLLATAFTAYADNLWIGYQPLLIPATVQLDGDGIKLTCETGVISPVGIFKIGYETDLVRFKPQNYSPDRDLLIEVRTKSQIQIFVVRGIEKLSAVSKGITTINYEKDRLTIDLTKASLISFNLTPRMPDDGDGRLGSVELFDGSTIFRGVYEGGVLDGKPHGVGLLTCIEKDSRETIFVGEFLYGRPYGKILQIKLGERREEDYCCCLEYDADLSAPKKRSYNVASGMLFERKEGNIHYYGLLVNDEPDGLGLSLYSDGSFYFGTYSEGSRHGKGMRFSRRDWWNPIPSLGRAIQPMAFECGSEIDKVLPKQ